MPHLSRRRFIGAASCAGVSSIPILSTLLGLRLSGAIANAAGTPLRGSATTDYRAVVCLFQSGGNDSFNLLVPRTGPSPTAADAYAEYASSRGDLAIAAGSLHPISPLNTPGRTFGINPAMPRLAQRFSEGRAAFVANVGTLIEPVANRTEVARSQRRLPLGLYSHSDQIEQWQTSVPHSRSGIGWAGRVLDLLQDQNPGRIVSMNISMDGANVWQTGTTGAEFAVSPGNPQEPDGGAVPLAGYDAGFDPDDPILNATSAAVDSQLALEYANLLQATYQRKRREALAATELYRSATAGPLPGGVAFPNTILGRQLRQVARAIGAHAALGARRQTFFVNRGGWDHHSDTLALQAAMLLEVDDALDAFWLQLVAIGLQDHVVLFTASDFGRTLSTNGQGSDHAWGGNHVVLGGAVHGGRIFGQYPGLALNPDGGGEVNLLDTGRGRLIPTTSCDVFFAELALWLGVPASDLHLVLPNLGNFISPSPGVSPLGFLTV